MADPRRRGDRRPLAAGPGPWNRRAAGRRGAGGPCRRGRPAARPGRPAFQGTLLGARPDPAPGLAGGARLRRLGPPGAAPFAAGPGRLRAGLRPAAGPAMGRGVRGGGAARVRVAPSAGRHDPPRHPAAACAGEGRAMGAPAPQALAAAALALRHRLRRGGRFPSVSVRLGPAPAAREPGLAGGAGKDVLGVRLDEARQKPRPPRARPARGASRRTPARPSPATRHPPRRGGPVRWIRVVPSATDGNARCVAAPRPGSASICIYIPNIWKEEHV